MPSKRSYMLPPRDGEHLCRGALPDERVNNHSIPISGQSETIAYKSGKHTLLRWQTGGNHNAAGDQQY